MTRLELIAEELSFPTSITFDDSGVPWVAESGLPWGGAAAGGRVWRLAEPGQRRLVAQGLKPPVTGLAWHQGALYISEGGHPARISRLGQDGRIEVVVDNLPGPGNYHANEVTFGPDGKLYFSQGAMTNTGVIGLDAYDIGWLGHLPHAPDIPGYDIVLCGHNFATPNPLSGGRRGRCETGAFSPFGVATAPGQRIAGRVPCTASVMRCNSDGSDLELVAWGLRNAFGLGFLADGRLLATDQGADDRGSRPVGRAPDLLFEVRAGAWYGWPDYVGGVPITDAAFAPMRGEPPAFVLCNHDELPAPERPLFRFPPHCSAAKFAVTQDGVYVALFGDEAPMTTPASEGAPRGVALVDPTCWTLSLVVQEPLCRPLAVRENPRDGALYIIDFGRFEMDAARGVVAADRSGALWRAWR